MKKNLAKRFGGTDLKERYARFETAKVVILPCPYEVSTSYQKGCINGPSAILEASDNMELFDDELMQDTYKIGIHTKAPLNLGRLSPPNMVREIKKNVLEILDLKKMPVLIGGEHSIAIGAVEAAAEIYKNLSVLHFDAHCDLRNKYQGSIYNHGCVARRFLENAPVAQIGVRSLSKEEKEFLNKNPEKLNSCRISSNYSWKNKLLDTLKDFVYISLDLDVLDPSVMPSVGTPEPGGMRWCELLDVLKKVSRKKRVVGFDIVELMPIKGILAPNFIAAKLIYRLIGYVFKDKKAR